MKLDNELIFNFFSLFTDLHETELEKWRSLCENAGDKIWSLRKRSANVKRNMERLCSAAAACAYCDYVILSGGGTGSSGELRVGDISVKESSHKTALIDASDTRAHFLTEIADLIDAPTGFAVSLAECKL
ncbi:MAG: hypothetical protein FWG94_01735 [Oscillospiraceae bacterium]|nr:hypothetical protein [Oscillospiraceae bacterium]